MSTAVLEGGAGPPVVLLHGPGASAVHWFWVLPELARTNTVVAPDLPGHGDSELVAGDLDAARVLAWLDKLIEHTCPTPPVLVGHTLGGAIGARLATERSASIARLVLVDTFGLVDFAPAPDFGAALEDFLADPTRRTHGALWRYCALDFDGLRARMGERWTAFEAYNIERARSAGQRDALERLMRDFGASAIPPAELRRIAVPTDLIWGRHDLATPLAAAERASELYGWPLQVIDACADDPPVEQPGELLATLEPLLSGAPARL